VAFHVVAEPVRARADESGRGDPQPAVTVRRERPARTPGARDADAGPGLAVPVQQVAGHQVRLKVVDLRPDVARVHRGDAHAEPGTRRDAQPGQRHRPPRRPVPVLDGGRLVRRIARRAAHPDVVGGRPARVVRRERERRMGPGSPVEVRDVAGPRVARGGAERPRVARRRRDRRVDVGAEPDRRRPAPASPVQRGRRGDVGVMVDEHPRVRRRAGRRCADGGIVGHAGGRLRNRDRAPAVAVPVPDDHRVAIAPRIGAGVARHPRVPGSEHRQPAQVDQRQHGRDAPAGRGRRSTGRARPDRCRHEHAGRRHRRRAPQKPPQHQLPAHSTRVCGPARRKQGPRRWARSAGRGPAASR
jgi:hypothetical protein